MHFWNERERERVARCMCCAERFLFLSYVLPLGRWWCVDRFVSNQLLGWWAMGAKSVWRTAMAAHVYHSNNNTPVQYELSFILDITVSRYKNNQRTFSPNRRDENDIILRRASSRKQQRTFELKRGPFSVSFLLIRSNDKRALPATSMTFTRNQSRRWAHEFLPRKTQRKQRDHDDDYRLARNDSHAGACVSLSILWKNSGIEWERSSTNS